MSEKLLPEDSGFPYRHPFPGVPKEFPIPSSGSFWGKLAIAAVAGVTGVVIGALLTESDGDVEDACDFDDEDTEDSD